MFLVATRGEKGRAVPCFMFHELFGLGCRYPKSRSSHSSRLRDKFVSFAVSGICLVVPKALVVKKVVLFVVSWLHPYLTNLVRSNILNL